MLIFSIIGFIYAEYIVFYVDSFSRDWIYLTPYPDDPFFDDYDLNIEWEGEAKEEIDSHSIPFKYHIMIIIVINFIACLVIEKVILPQCSKLWRKNKMKRLKQKLDSDTEKRANLNIINDVKNYIREQRKTTRKIEEED